MLNPSQHDAVHTLSGPMLVLAGAGSGKTRVITYRIAELIRTGTDPSRILAVTFTNKAAAEMQERAAALLNRRRSERPEISTFHSLCVRILRRHIHLLGYPTQFAIYDRRDQLAVARDALRQIRVPGEALRPADLIGMIGNWKSSAVGPAEAESAAATDKQHLAAAAYRRYQKNLKACGAVDFDDLLLLADELYRKLPGIRRDDAGRYDHLLIDEYQDTNATQYRIVKQLASGHRNLCVVGDDDQAIYGSRGADVTHILRFKQDWPDAKLVCLEENYRSTAAILEIANRLIGFNTTRHAKVLRPARAAGEQPKVWQFADEDEEAREVVADIRRRLDEPGCEPRDFAILFRTNEQPRAFEMELGAPQLPYVLIGGKSFYDRAEVRDLLAYFKLLANPRDEAALLRIINTPPRGISQAPVARLTEQAVASGKPLWDVLHEAAQHDKVPPAAAEAIGKFQHMIEAFHRRAAQASPVQVAKQLVEEIAYRDHITRKYPDESEQQTRWASVEELINAVARYERRNKKPTLRGFLDNVALAEREEESDKESQLARNAVALLTLHSAKGLEFPQVYLVGMEEELLPHRRAVESEQDTAIDEERRLCYVGVTRAQDRLTMSLSLTRFKWGKSRPTTPSRFLYELTGQHKRPQEKPKPARGGKRPARTRK